MCFSVWFPEGTATADREEEVMEKEEVLVSVEQLTRVLTKK